MPPARVAVRHIVLKEGAPWQLDEYVVVADLWLRRGRSSGVHDREVVELAAILGRSPASVSRRLGNFEGTAHPGRGLKPVTGEALALFRAMSGDVALRQKLLTSSMRRLRDPEALTTPAHVVRSPLMVDPEDSRTETVEVQSGIVDRQARRAEAALVRGYRAWLDPRKERLRGILIPVGDRYLRVDLYDSSLDVLIEAKAQASRNPLRMAIGQLVDYRRYLPMEPRLAVLVPEEPDLDLTALLQLMNIAAIWPQDDRFLDNAEGSITRRFDHFG